MEKDERAVHVEHMGKKGLLIVFWGNDEIQKQLRTTRHRREDNINVNLIEIELEVRGLDSSGSGHRQMTVANMANFYK
jgi:hypothetical protein